MKSHVERNFITIMRYDYFSNIGICQLCVKFALRFSAKAAMPRMINQQEY